VAVSMRVGESGWLTRHRLYSVVCGGADSR
jgi:hypothetical protein